MQRVTFLSAASFRRRRSNCPTCLKSSRAAAATGAHSKPLFSRWYFRPMPKAAKVKTHRSTTGASLPTIAKLGLIAYGIIEANAGKLHGFSLGPPPVRHPPRRNGAFYPRPCPAHSPAHLNGMLMVQCIQDMTSAGEEVNLTLPASATDWPRAARTTPRLAASTRALCGSGSPRPAFLSRFRAGSDRHDTIAGSSRGQSRRF